MMPQMPVHKVKSIIINIYLRVLIQDIRLYYVSILVLLKAAVMVPNANMLMELKNYVSQDQILCPI